MDRRKFLAVTATLLGGGTLLREVPPAGDVEGDRSFTRVAECGQHICRDGFAQGVPQCQHKSICNSESCGLGFKCETVHVCGTFDCSGQSCPDVFTSGVNPQVSNLGRPDARSPKVRARQELAMLLDRLDGIET